MSAPGRPRGQQFDRIYSLRPMNNTTIYDENEDPLDENDEGTFVPRPRLEDPYVQRETVGDLIGKLKRNVIDVNPVYQREIVWTCDQMSGLIDSLLENFHVPPIIYSKRSHSDGGRRFTLICVDGKQRLSSILDFHDGKILCHDYDKKPWWFCDITKTRCRNVLPEMNKQRFLGTILTTIEYGDLTSREEEDLFQRVQKGKPLTTAEKLRASTGAWQRLATQFTAEFPNIYALLKDPDPAKLFQLTLCCFNQVLEIRHPSAANGLPSYKANDTAIAALLTNERAVDAGIKSHFGTVWTILSELLQLDADTFTNNTKYLRGVKVFAPLEMVAIIVLISHSYNKRDNRTLIEDIRALRTALNHRFPSGRLGPVIWKFIWNFVDGLDTIRGSVDGSTVQQRAGVAISKPNAISMGARKRPCTPSSGVSHSQPKRPQTQPEQPTPPANPVGRSLPSRGQLTRPTRFLNSPQFRRVRTSPVEQVVDKGVALTSLSSPPYFRRASPEEETPPRSRGLKSHYFNRESGESSRHTAAPESRHGRRSEPNNFWSPGAAISASTPTGGYFSRSVPASDRPTDMREFGSPSPIRPRHGPRQQKGGTKPRASGPLRATSTNWR